ncbi:hypothetical protein [Sphingosinicella sp. CPCC 101087]|uniref:hypothetical protein n=1 Tax=Sphingosinicella sp. CPCC 101087 TaxID=2497754 RepID=UPI00101CC9D7|nr:hypothetical protein [Sphingosinicella sp. CPCC 101087]
MHSSRKFPVRRFFCVVVSSAALVASAAVAAPTRGLSDLPGRVTPSSVEIRNARVPRGQAAAMAEAIDGILARLLETPALRSPRGFAINRGVIISAPAADEPASAPVRAEAMLLLREVNPAEGSRADAAGAYSGIGEGPAIRITVNDAGALFPNAGEGIDGREPFYELTNNPGQRDGFAVLRFRSRDHVVITRPGLLPYRLVTKQEVLEREVEEYRRAVADLAGNAAPPLLATLTEREAELAALPDPERSAPACQNGSRRGGSFVPCTERGAHHVVALNPAYFDRSRPRTALQLVTISAPSAGGVGHALLEPVARSAVEALDLAAIQRLLN